MNNYLSHELQHENYLEWRTYLLRFPWEWIATLTFKDEINFFTAQRHFRRWRLSIINEEKLRIGAYTLSSYKKGRIHLHALLFGRNRHGKILSRCSLRKWESRWLLNSGYARITPVISNFGICNYVALHFLGFKSDHAQVDSYDRNLLKQALRLQRDGLDGFDGLR